jgi:hypothetical protein
MTATRVAAAVALLVSGLALMTSVHTLDRLKRLQPDGFWQPAELPISATHQQIEPGVFYSALPSPDPTVEPQGMRIMRCKRINGQCEWIEDKKP